MMKNVLSIRSLVFTALFSALFIVLSLQQMKLTLTPIPITLQTFAVILAGLFLKPKQAFASILAVIALTATGLPLIGGKGGLSLLLGPTGGFIFAFPFCAMFISLVVGKMLENERLMRNKAVAAIVLFVIMEGLSSLLTYVLGIPWMMKVLDFTLHEALVAGFYPFILGDAIKSALGVAVAIGLASLILRIRSSSAGAPSASHHETMIIR
jgi:biotin transport system substrate-specific component